MLSKSPDSFNFLYICIQPQSRSLSTSHFSFFEPPHGPLSRPLVQTVRGHIVAVLSIMHSPQSIHFCVKWPPRSTSPRNNVSSAGTTFLTLVPSFITCVPSPQAKTSTASVCSKTFYSYKKLFYLN